LIFPIFIIYNKANEKSIQDSRKKVLIMLKVGLIGYGGMGRAHSGAYEAISDRVTIAAAADLQEEKRAELKEKYGCVTYETGMELIENADVDFVDICLPTFLHAEHAVAAMRKGYDVFLEKPVCLNEEEAKMLLDVQKETGKKVQIGQVVRFMSDYVWLKNVVDSGKYGKVLSANFMRMSEMPTWGWNDWYSDDAKCGGVGLDLHIHDADFIRYTFGDDIKDIKAMGVRNAEGRLRHLNVMFDYGDKTISAESSWDCTPSFGFLACYKVYFEKATVVCENGKITVYGDEVEEIDVQESAKDLGINIPAVGGYSEEIRYFVDEILNGNGKEMAPLSEGIKSAQLVWREMDALK